MLAILIALGFGTLGILIALQDRLGEAVQSAFPLLFFLLFLSSMNLPRNLIAVGWFRDLATANPVSYMIEGDAQPGHRRAGTYRRSRSASSSRC